MGQNCKVVHQPEKTPEIAELNRLSHLGFAPAMQFISPNIIFIGFEPCHVRFDPYPDRVVHAKQGYASHISADGPKDTLSVKNGAIGQDIGQKLNNCEFWRCSQRASEAGSWTDHASMVRTKTQSNHTCRGTCSPSVRSKNETAPRDVPLSPEAYAAILEWLAARPVASPYLFTRFDGRGDGENVRASCQPLSAFSVRTVVKRAAEAVGIAHVKPHDFRRFVGTVVAKLHGYKQAQQVLGHQDAATTLNNYVLEDIEPGVTDSLF